MLDGHFITVRCLFLFICIVFSTQTCVLVFVFSFGTLSTLYGSWCVLSLMCKQWWKLLWEFPKVTWLRGVVRNGGLYSNILNSNSEILLITPLHGMFSWQSPMLYIFLSFFSTKICLSQCWHQQLSSIFWSSKETSPLSLAEFLSIIYRPWETITVFPSVLLNQLFIKYETEKIWQFLFSKSYICLDI